MENKSFEFVHRLVGEMQQCHQSSLTPPQISIPASIPPNIAKTKKPPKEEVIKAHMSRMPKKKILKNS